MALLIVGLLVFLGVHSLRIVADGWRHRQVQRLGEGTFKGLYALASAVGLGLIVWGYAIARRDPLVLWSSPVALRHVAVLLMLFAFVLLVAAYVPRNAFKARWHHPMLLGVKLWALAHLLANNTLADVLLFGSFLAWAVIDFVSARRRDRAAGTVYPVGTVAGTASSILLGGALWLLFVFWAHRWLFGVQPIG